MCPKLRAELATSLGFSRQAALDSLVTHEPCNRCSAAVTSTDTCAVVSSGCVGGLRSQLLKRSFGRDVYVNVVANLVAAGIIYLLGVAVGWFPANGWVLSVSGATVGGAAVLIVVIDEIFVKRIDSLVALILLGVGGGGAGPALLYFGAHVDQEWIAIVFFILGGVFSIGAAYALVPILWTIHQIVADSGS